MPRYQNSRSRRSCGVSTEARGDGTRSSSQNTSTFRHYRVRVTFESAITKSYACHAPRLLPWSGRTVSMLLSGLSGLLRSRRAHARNRRGRLVLALSPVNHRGLGDRGRTGQVGRLGYRCEDRVSLLPIDVAEREGFEPPEPFPVQWFSRPPPSTTRPSLHVKLRLNSRNFVLISLFAGHVSPDV